MKTLLLADDSVTIQRVIELTFAHENVRVVSVSDGRRAVQWMENESPDIVLVDVEVPDIDGYAVAAHVKQSSRLRGVPVLLLAGAFEPVDQDRMRSIGCDGILVKPFEPQQLVTRVKALLQKPSSHAGSNGNGPEPARRTHDSEPSTVTAFPGNARSTGHAHAAPTGPMAEGDPEPLEPPTRPVWEASPTAVPNLERLEPPTASRVSLVNAFSALLAAEQSSQPATAPAVAQPVVSEAAIEEAVRRVLLQMTDAEVHRIVAETTERVVKEQVAGATERLVKAQVAETAERLVKAEVAETTERLVKAELAETAERIVQTEVAETAERLVREEIEKIKAKPE